MLTMTITRRNRGLWAGVTLAMALAVVPASAQDVDPRLERIRAELPAEAVEQIEARIAAADEAGLPVEPLLDKAVEGIAKRVPGPAVAGAVDRLAQELGRAQAILADGVPPAATDVAAVADAMRRGVPEPAIAQITDGTRPENPVALAVHTLGDLIERDVPVDQAVAVLEAWQARGADSEELRELPEAIERLIRQGVLPGQAAAAVANAMRSGPPAGVQGGDGMPGKAPEGGPPIPPGAGPPSETPGGGDPGGGPPNDPGPPGGG